MSLNISFLATSLSELFQVDNKHKLYTFIKKEMATEVAADALGEKGKNCVVPVTIKEWGVTTGFPYKTRLLDPVQSAPTVE